MSRLAQGLRDVRSEVEYAPEGEKAVRLPGMKKSLARSRLDIGVSDDERRTRCSSRLKRFGGRSEIDSWRSAISCMNSFSCDRSLLHPTALLCVLLVPAALPCVPPAAAESQFVILNTF